MGRVPARLKEADLLRGVLDMLTRFGWRGLHIRPGKQARGGQGWITPMSGPGCKGWPDIFAVRGPRLLAAELKGPKGKLEPEQREWLDTLAAAGVECFEWTPAHWPDEITRVLR